MTVRKRSTPLELVAGTLRQGENWTRGHAKQQVFDREAGVV